MLFITLICLFYICFNFYSTFTFIIILLLVKFYILLSSLIFTLCSDQFYYFLFRITFLF